MDLLPPWVIETFKVLGTSAAFIVIWYLTHKSSERRFDTFMEQLNTEREIHIEQIAKEREAAVNERKAVANEFMEIRKQTHENYLLMSDLLRIQTQILSQIQPMIQSNTTELRQQSTTLALINQQLQLKDKP